MGQAPYFQYVIHLAKVFHNFFSYFPYQIAKSVVETRNSKTQLKKISDIFAMMRGSFCHDEGLFFVWFTITTHHKNIGKAQHNGVKSYMKQFYDVGKNVLPQVYKSLNTLKNLKKKFHFVWRY